ncbi:MAG: hypothetical protein WDO56_00075 [Gammaproteobacteria bacterium]
MSGVVAASFFKGYFNRKAAGVTVCGVKPPVSLGDPGLSVAGRSQSARVTVFVFPSSRKVHVHTSFIFDFASIRLPFPSRVATPALRSPRKSRGTAEESLRPSSSQRPWWSWPYEEGEKT